MSRVAFSDLRMAAYCPRKLYYARTTDADREPPPRVDGVRSLTTRYEDLLEASDATLEAEPIVPDPSVYRARLARTRDRLQTHETTRVRTDDEQRSDPDGQPVIVDRWDDCCHPADTDVFVLGRECHGIVQKVLEEPLEPVLVSAGEPPPQGVWKPQRVHAVAAAKALAWERERRVGGAWFEYPAHGVIRYVPMTTRRKAEYRRTIRTVAELDGPPARLQNRAKCEACEYSAECGVRTRSLRSLLGFG